MEKRALLTWRECEKLQQQVQAVVRWLKKRRQQLPVEIEALQKRVAHEADADLYYQLHKQADPSST